MNINVTNERLNKMKRVLDSRLAKLTIVLDNIFDPHNISAVLRSCDAFGIQDVHIIETTEKFKVNKEISHKCEKWLTLHFWKNFNDCAKFLKNNNFKIFSTCFAEDAVPIEQIPLENPVAIVMGNEHRGVDENITNLCDGKIIIPMCGFVQSLNVSVASAITLAILSSKIRKMNDNAAYLPENRKQELLTKWLDEHNKK